MGYLRAIFAGAAICLAQPVFAFDTGHHIDATWRAGDHQGFSSDARRLMQVANWLVDYYSESPTSPEDVEEALGKMHFDNLFSTEHVDHNWKYLLTNYQNAVSFVVDDDDYNDAQKAVMVLTMNGMMLHTIQDFYTHSNWSSFYPKTSSGYNGATYLSKGLPPTASSSNPLQTGYYPDADSTNAPDTAFPHGTYFTGGNKDSHIRPSWDEAFVFSYIESIRFLIWAQDVVDAADGSLWDNMRSLKLSSSDDSDLKDDYEAAQDVSMFVKGLTDTTNVNGHYKGNLSGDRDEFLTASSDFVSSSASFVVKLVRDTKLQDLLVPCLNDFDTQTCPTLTTQFSETGEIVQNMVSVNIMGIEELNSDTDPAGDEPDYFPIVTINDQKMTDRVLQDIETYEDDDSDYMIEDQPTSAWWLRYGRGTSHDTVSIKIEVYDADTGFFGDDDHIDISGDGHNVDITYTFATGAISGDVGSGVHNSRATAVTSQGGPSGDYAKITFFVTHLPINY